MRDQMLLNFLKLFQKNLEILLKFMTEHYEH